MSRKQESKYKNKKVGACSQQADSGGAAGSHALPKSGEKSEKGIESGSEKQF
jgi:hypothetical protein